MAITLNADTRILTSREYGKRLIFVTGQTNPRDELGKNGVTLHGWFSSLFYKTIIIETVVIDEKGQKQNRILRVNRSSLLQYVNAVKPGSVNGETSDIDLVEQLHSVVQPANAINNDEGKQLRHAGQRNRQPLARRFGEWVDSLRGRFYNWLYHTTITSLSAIKKRFFFINKEKDYFEVSEMLAKRRYKKSREKVPAYQAHVAGAEDFVNNRDPHFNDIPITTKDNYIKKNVDHDWDLHKHGLYPEKHKVDTSTGTTGKPTVWVKGEKELTTVKSSLRVAVEIESGTRPINYINAFALGPWATGMTAYELMRDTGSTFPSGPDISKIIDECERIYNYGRHLIEIAVTDYLKKHAEFNNEKVFLISLVTQLLNEAIDDRELDKKARLNVLLRGHRLAAQSNALLELINKIDAVRPQIIISGYPPFLKDLVDFANKNNFNFKKYHARGVVGGQAISEALRDKLIEAGFSKINSSYGASDLDINIGVETEFEIALRKELEKNPALAAELYGKNKGLPMVFHYDPFNYHVETDRENNLIYTCNRNDRSSPRVRYQLGDTGRVYACSDIEALLAKHGIFHIKPRINFPLLFVWGRDSAVAYRGSKVSFTDLERAITTLDSSNQCVKRAFYSYEENGDEKFEIWIELSEGVPLPNKEQAESFLKGMLTEMGKINQDLNYHLQLDNNAELPRVRFFTKGHSPISDAGGARKQVLVFNKANLPRDYSPPANVDQTLVVSITKAFFRGVIAQPQPVVGYSQSSPRLMTLSPAAHGQSNKMEPIETAPKFGNP